MNSERLKFAMIGTGNFAPVMAGFIVESADVVAICDPSSDARARFVKVTGLKVAEFSDYESLLKKAEIDAVVLTGPNFTHAPTAVAAAQAGKHVFCEKTMAPTVRDCWAMVRACELAKVKLMVGHKRRLRPPWARIIQLRELLGAPVAMSIVGYFDGRPDNFQGWWTREAESGGVLTLSGVHELDWMRAVCGDVEAVSAIAGPQVDRRYDFSDSIHVMLRFRSGAIGFLGVSLSYPLRRYRQVYGAEITCQRGGMRLVSSFHEADVYWKLLSENEEHHERFEEAGGDPVGANEALRKESREFVRWIVDGTEPCLTWREGLRCVEVIEAARRSASESGAWMTLPLYPELESQG
jgi:UDP-N-acetylglucosamine 3-dehydrogenase